MNLYTLAERLKPRCPHCFKKLTKGEERCYETLVEHVSNPNMESHPSRPTMTCSCELGKFGYWDWEGSGFYITGDYREFYEKFPRNKTFAYHAGIFSFDWFHAIDMWLYWKIGRGRNWLKKGKNNAR